MDHFEVTQDELDHAAYLTLVTRPAYGAVASFVGTVRSPNAGETVDYIDYEGYESMIETQMGVLAKELRDTFDLGNIVFAHRLGRLQPGEASIAIVISSKHRKDALAACHRGIDRVKELLPVWKHEVTDKGSAWVEGSTEAGTPL